MFQIFRGNHEAAQAGGVKPRGARFRSLGIIVATLVLVGLYIGVIMSNIAELERERYDFFLGIPELDRTLLTSRPFASPCGSRLKTLGLHPLKGIEVPQEIFGLP